MTSAAFEEFALTWVDELGLAVTADLYRLLLHLAWFTEPGENGLLFVGEKGALSAVRPSGRKWRKVRALVGLPDNIRFYDLRHTGHTLSTWSGAPPKDTLAGPQPPPGE
ncbi:hypothetical protein [Streptomyces gobiensis]|uniref:hypothetical protein n=1 Tax=Streptomyces gobiensis TaxID=2875706 RepID=UPI0030D05958